MKKRALDIGQCPPDHAAIRHLLESLNFDVRKCDTPSDALRILAEHTYDLVLVNRKIDIDYSDGILLIQKLKQNERTKQCPVMLVSNYPEYQQKAVAAGAIPGFGKNELNKSSTTELILNAIAGHEDF